MERLLTVEECSLNRNLLKAKIGVFFLKQELLGRRIDGANLLDPICREISLITDDPAKAIQEKSKIELRERVLEYLTQEKAIDEFYSRTKCHA